MFSTIKIEPKQLSFAKLDEQFGDFFNKRALLPMSKLFSITYDSPEYIQAVGSTFPSQSLAFVHMCMYGYNQKYQRPFLKFVMRSTREKPTEAMFREIFGMSTETMAIEMRGYVEGGHYKYVTYKTDGLPSMPALELRPATDAEMGRIKGDALRLANRLDDARLELLSPVLRGESDPRLLASIAELELKQNNLVPARKYFESAAKAEVDLPGPYVHLAQLRYDEALKAAGADGKFTPAQVASVLTPLFTARKLAPRRGDLYTLIADTWEHSATPPSAQNLQVLDEGVQAFPSDMNLVYKDAALKIRNHISENAAALVDYGLQVAATEPAEKSRFEALKAELPPAPPTAAPTSAAAAPANGKTAPASTAKAKP
jgi:hypothetical protein